MKTNVHKQTVSFYTLGCRLNQSETASLHQSFEDGGYQVLEGKATGDIAIINTCTVTQRGDTDTRRLVNRLVRGNQKVRIALIGCQAQIQKGRLEKLPNIHWIVGTEKKMDLLSILRKTKEGAGAQVITPQISRESFTMPITGVDKRHTRANLKVQDGCDFFCLFCEIPYARGRARSREFSDIIKEAESYVAAGHKETVLTGINLGNYKYEKKDIADVVTALEDIKGLERIRISSIEPTTISKALIKKMGKRSKICRYLHIPLQSGSDEILNLMKRRYRVSEFKEFIHKVYDAVPEICIGTDVIVGFPGETDFLFTQTADLVKSLPFSYLHVFSYSSRNMAKSKDLPGHVSAYTIRKRSQFLRGLSFKKKQFFLKSLVGTKQTVLFESKKTGYWTGFTDNYVRVFISSKRNLANQIVEVRLKDVDGQTVYGEAC